MAAILISKQPTQALSTPFHTEYVCQEVNILPFFFDVGNLSLFGATISGLEYVLTMYCNSVDGMMITGP